MTMDIARILFTVLCFGTFFVILLVTYRRGAKGEYDETAKDIFLDDDTPDEGTAKDDTCDDDTHGNGVK